MALMSAQLDVLTAGCAAIPRVASTVVLIRDGDAVIVVDPGMVADRSRILGPLADLGVDPADVTDVVFSRHHPDQTELERSRAQLLERGPALIVPGHGEPFSPPLRRA
jgi:glyoxylase-like metal-dependent hydrolase (beta-lactamase superfamily II)